MVFFRVAGDEITPSVFVAHPSEKVECDQNREQEVANRNDMRGTEMVCIQAGPINQDSVMW